MECPKCGAIIDDSALVCPNCKKVLKIVCPVCRAINEKNVCRKCGEILVTKCVKCGKINQMKEGKCVKCGYSTEMSALQNESNAETFAVIKINFLNDDVIKSVLGSNKVFSKFKSNVDNMISECAGTVGVRRQVLKDGTYVLRFNKVYTFDSSAKSAIESAIEIVNRITRLNVKMLDRKDVGIKCTLTILKQDADKDPYALDSGMNITLLNQDTEKDTKALDYCHIMTDEDFYEVYNSGYQLETLESKLVDGKMKQFYEINIKDFIKMDEYLREIRDERSYEEDNPEIPSFVQEAMEFQDSITQNTFSANEPEGIKLYAIDELIDFDEVNCAFYTTENNRIMDNITEVLQEVPTGICAIRGSNIYQPYTLRLLAGIDDLGIYQNVVPITCHDEMKYSPYSFFRELVSSVFEYTVSQKLFNQNDFSIFGSYDKSNLIRDLVSLRPRPITDLQDTRDAYYKVFLSLLQSIPNTLIYIENFEKIDESSLYVLSLLFEHFDDMNVTYVISYDKDYSLHKKLHFLLSRPYYTEITLLPTPFAQIVALNEEYYKDVLNDFYFKRISKYAMGSTLFIDYAIQYLIESKIYEEANNTLMAINSKTVILPSNLSGLIKRRLNLLKNDKETVMFLAMCVLLGTRIDFKTASTLGFDNWKQIADKLADMGHLYFYNDCIYFPNYELLRENILGVIYEKDLKTLAGKLFENVFEENMSSPVKAFLYDKFDEHEKVVTELEKLANLDLSLGDISGYVNCSSEILNKLDKYSKDWSEEELEKYKSSIYENIANNLFEYNPVAAREIADNTLENLLKTGNIKNYMDLCSKMIQGALDNGEYLYALNLTHKILAVSDNASIDPESKNFSLEFLVMTIIHVKILFGLGGYKDCTDIGYNVLSVLDSARIEKIEFKSVTKDDFKSLLTECIGYIALSIILSMREDVNEFLDIVNKLYDFIPKEYAIFSHLQSLIHGEKVTVTNNMRGQNIFSNIFYHIIRAFSSYKSNPIEFAKEVYKAKLVAQDSYMYTLELFADLLIAYSYIGLNSYVKAGAMLSKIIKTSQDKGMNFITYLGWYITSILNLQEQKYDIAYGMLNNATIQMEKTGSGSEYLTLLNKINMYKVLKALGKDDKAELCLEQAKYIIGKYELNFNLNI